MMEINADYLTVNILIKIEDVHFNIPRHSVYCWAVADVAHGFAGRALALYLNRNCIDAICRDEFVRLFNKQVSGWKAELPPELIAFYNLSGNVKRIAQETVCLINFPGEQRIPHLR